MKKTFLFFSFVAASALTQPANAQSTLEQWQKLMPNSGVKVQEPATPLVQPVSQGPERSLVVQKPALQMSENSQAAHRGFIDPYDAEMHDATIAARSGQWSRAWNSFGYGLHSLCDPELNAARLEIESEKNHQ